MLFLKLLLSSGLIFAATTSTRNESLCYQPSEYVKPIQYDMKFTSRIGGNLFFAECNISINILNKTHHIYLQSKRLNINNIVLFTNFEKYHENDKDTVYKPIYNNYTVINEKDTIDIPFMDELSPGNYTLNIKYDATVGEVFRIFNLKEETTWIDVPHIQIMSIRRSFPCRGQQDLSLKANFNISIGCYQFTDLSNVLSRNIKKSEDNLLWTHFGTTPVMWTNHTTVIVSNYLFSLDNKTRIIKMRYRVDTGCDIEFAKNVAENITLFFENEWKHSNHTLMMDHVAIPNFQDKVFRLVLYRETDIIYDKNLYPVAHQIQVAQLVGHEVAQQWFYNLNKPFPSIFWFNKGLTTLLATYAVNKIYPDYRIMNLFVVQNQHYSFHLDSAYSIWSSTVENMSLFKIRQIIKAPFILRMMQHAFTEEIFWKHIRSYINKPTVVNFWEEFVIPAMKPDIALDIITYRHYPIIKIIRNYEDAMSQANVSIQNIDTLYIDCVPLTFTTQTSPDFNNFTHHVVCTSRDLKLPLTSKENGWIIFNIQQVGYYRVNYDDENWRRISHYLNHDDYTKIHVLNRAQIIDDAFHLMIVDQLNSSIFWDIIMYLNREEDYIAWYPMFKALEYMFSTSFAVLKDKHENLKNDINDKLNGTFRKIKYEEINESDHLRKCLQQEVARWACFLGDITCKEKANNKLKQHIEDPKTHRLLPWWKEWTYCNGLMLTKEETTWQSVYDIGLNKSDTKFLEYLACPEDTNLIKKYLRFNQNISTEQEYPNSFNSFLHIITKHAKNQIILEYILDHFNEIKPKYVSTPVALLIIVNNVYFVPLTQQMLYAVGSIIETNLVEVNNIEDLLNRRKRYQANEIHHVEERDYIEINEHNSHDQIRRQINIRKDQIKRQRLRLQWQILHSKSDSNKSRGSLIENVFRSIDD